jgi:tetratricopeptide (TPR) repeat protein
MPEPAPSQPRPASEPAAQGSTLDRTADSSDVNSGLPELRAQAHGLGRNALLALLRADQCRCWGQQNRVRVEWYLRQFPALAADAQAVQALIANEISLRRLTHDPPTQDEYVRRFPEHAAALREHRGLEPPWSGPTGTFANPGENGPGEETPCPPPATPTDSLAPPATPALPPAEDRTPSRAPGTVVQTPEKAAAAAKASALAADQPSIPGYEVIAEVGRGGMGIVYRARQLRPNRTVALKMILAGAQGRAEYLTRFRLETEAVARLHHPNIVQIYEVGEHQGRPYCCLEFLEGGNLDQALGGAPQPVQTAARSLETLARAMHAAHQEGIVHRDLKPGNILLTADGTLKISDFGLAKHLDDDSWKTHSGVIMGTPSYMAPEQAAGHVREVGPLTDVYALGAILYELLTGRPPFRAATMLETLDQVRTQEPVPPRRLQPNVPRDLETICLKCLQKEPQKRYASALELAEDVERFRKNEPIRGRPVPGWERLLKWVRRRPAAAALIVMTAVALLSVVFGALAYLGKRARDAEALARTAQQALADAQRGDEVRQLVHDGEKAKEAGDWQNARVLLVQALDKIRPDEESLGELRAHAQALLEEARNRLEEVAGRQQAEDRFQQFTKQRDKALFHATLATGEGLLANVKETRAAARKALELAEVPLEGLVPLARKPSWTDEENAVALAGCYEMLLVLAEAEGQALPGEEGGSHVRQALRILDRAAALGCPIHPSEAYHLRRARYLEQLGDQAAAGEERRRAAGRPPATALDYYLLGDEEYRQGHIAAAVHDFESALAEEPDQFWARYFVSVGYLRLGRAAEARVGLTACLSQRRDFVWIYLLRGFADAQLKEFKAAEEDFQKALQLNPTPDAAHVLYANRAVLWFQQGQLEKAVDDLHQAIELKPKEYQAYVTLAQVFQKQKKWAAAAGQLDHAIALEPDLAVLYRLRARVEVESPEPDLEAALHLYEKAVAIETQAGPSLTLAKDHAERGRIFQRRQQYAEAVSAYDAALKIEPGYTRAYLGRADAELELGQYREVLASLDDYLKKGGRPRAEVYRARGLARARLGDYAGAITDYSSALESKPDDAGIHGARGWAYLACRAYDLAADDFDRAIRLEPDSGPAYNGRAYARVQLGQDQPALEDAEAALRRGPPSARLFHDAARVFGQVIGRMDTAAGPRSPLGLERRSLCQDRALGLLRKALEATPVAERTLFWREHVRPDPALAPLRGSSMFAQMDREYSR